MTIQKMISKSIKPVLDNMDGSYAIRIKNNKPYYNKARDTYSTERVNIMYLYHCESCGKEDFRYKRPDLPKAILCRKKECRQIFTLKNIKPIKHPYQDRLLTIKECPEGYFRNNDPLKAWLGAIKSNEEIRLAHQTEEWKQSQLAKHIKWSYAYYVKSNPDLIIDSSKSWQQRQKEFYKDNPWNNEQHLKFVNDNKKDWEMIDKKENPGKYIVRIIIRRIFAIINQKKTKPSNKLGFDIEGMINQLRKSAKQLGYAGLKDIKATKQYHVDHIIPCAKYNLEKHSERLKCNNPLNLRWLLVEENTSKGVKIRPQDLVIIKTLPKEIYPEGFQLDTIY